MSLAHVALVDLREHHLSGLIERGLKEFGRTEYKRRLPGAKDKERKELLGDVSSFANACGYPRATTYDAASNMDVR